MARESKAAKRERALEVCRRVDEVYPGAECALHFSDPFTLTIAVLLSAQTTDKGVNKVTPELFSKYGTPEKMAAASIPDIEEIIHPIGFYHTKAKNCVALAQRLMAEYGGVVPGDMESLQTLPGVGRKTANIVLNDAFGITEGIAVDTHVFRIAHKLKFSNADAPAATEKDLLDILPEDHWCVVNHQWVQFGRDTCIARRPRCEACPLADLCPSCDS